MERAFLVNALEAVLFAAGEPMSAADLKKVFERYLQDMQDEAPAPVELHDQAAIGALVKELIAELRARWEHAGDARGFTLVEVGGGLTFRSNPRYAQVVLAMREEKPQRLSKAALETLAIIAYRQPVTKPEVDHIRGVDCGGTIRMLLERQMIRIVGKKEEPGRPMLYGTTKTFLSFFNLGGLTQLPSLREYHELNEDSQETLESFDSENGRPSLHDLSASAKKLQLSEEPAVAALDEAVRNLDATESAAHEALAAEGLGIDQGKEGDGAPSSQD